MRHKNAINATKHEYYTNKGDKSMNFISEKDARTFSKALIIIVIIIIIVALSLPSVLKPKQEKETTITKVISTDPIIKKLQESNTSWSIKCSKIKFKNINKETYSILMFTDEITLSHTQMSSLNEVSKKIDEFITKFKKLTNG